MVDRGCVLLLTNGRPSAKAARCHFWEMSSFFVIFSHLDSCTSMISATADRRDPSPDNRHEDVRASTSLISYARDETDLLEALLANGPRQTLMDRLLGCAYGQALGDAYGLSTEFEDRHSVAGFYPNRDMLIPFPNYVLTGHSRRWARGDWTDDTDQWILILDSLTEKDGNEKTFAKKLDHWIRRGFQELGDYAGMGLGANVSQVLVDWLVLLLGSTAYLSLGCSFTWLCNGPVDG